LQDLEIVLVLPWTTSVGLDSVLGEILPSEVNMAEGRHQQVLHLGLCCLQLADVAVRQKHLY